MKIPVAHLMNFIFGAVTFGRVLSRTHRRGSDPDAVPIRGPIRAFGSEGKVHSHAPQDDA